MMFGGDTEMPLFLEHNHGDLYASKVSKEYPLILALMQNVAAFRVDMFWEADYHLVMAGRIVDVDNYHKHLLQLFAGVG